MPINFVEWLQRQLIKGPIKPQQNKRAIITADNARQHKVEKEYEIISKHKIEMPSMSSYLLELSGGLAKTLVVSKDPISKII